MTERLVNVDELAEYLGVKKSWVYQRSREKGPGSMPTLKIGKYCRWRLSDVKAWIQSQNEAQI